MSRHFLAAVLRARVARQHRRSGIGRLIPELGMDQPLAQRVDDRRDGSQRLEGKNLHHEDVSRLLRIAGMGADKVFDLPPAPARIDIVLRQQDDQQSAPPDLGQQVAVELVARLERVIDEDAFAEDVRAFIEVGRQSGDPADRAGGAEGDAVVGMSVADEDVERFISGHRYLDWLRVVGEPSAGSAAARHAGAGQRARTPSRDSRYERSHCRDDPLSGDRRLASRLQAGELPLGDTCALAGRLCGTVRAILSILYQSMTHAEHFPPLAGSGQADRADADGPAWRQGEIPVAQGTMARNHSTPAPGVVILRDAAPVCILTKWSTQIGQEALCR